MGVLQEIILMMDYITVITWDMQLLQELLYTGIHTTIASHRSHNALFGEYTYRLFMEENHTPGYLLL